MPTILISSLGDELCIQFLAELEKPFLHEVPEKFTEYAELTACIWRWPVQHVVQEYCVAAILHELCRSGFRPYLKGSTPLYWREKHLRDIPDIDIRLDPSIGVEWGLPNNPNAYPPSDAGSASRYAISS